MLTVEKNTTVAHEQWLLCFDSLKLTELREDYKGLNHGKQEVHCYTKNCFEILKTANERHWIIIVIKYIGTDV